MSKKEWNNRVEKILVLLESGTENIPQAFILLETLIDLAILEGEQDTFLPIFTDIDLENATCGSWLTYENLNYSEKEEFCQKGYFWTLYEYYLRLFPYKRQDIPTTLRLRHALDIPSFLSEDRSCQQLIFDNTTISFKNLDHCPNVTNILFDMDYYSLSEIDFDIKLDSLTHRKKELFIEGPNLYAQWKIIDGKCTPTILKIGHVRGSYKYSDISLSQFPHLQFSDIKASDLTCSLWRQRTPYDVIEFSEIQLHLNQHVQDTIAERVTSIYHDTQNDEEEINHLDYIFEQNYFPNLKKILIKTVWGSVCINKEVLSRYPKLEHIMIIGDLESFTIDDSIWEMNNNLQTITIDNIGENWHHWEFSQNPGSLKDRLIKASVMWEWATQNEEVLQNVTHLNIFQSDVDWTFIRQCNRLQKLTVEGAQGDGDFAILAPQEFFDSTPFTTGVLTKNTDKYGDLLDRCDSLSDLTFARSTYISKPVWAKLKELTHSQDIPLFFQKWLKKNDGLSEGGFSLWIDANNKLHMKAYRNVGMDYRDTLKKDSNGVIESIVNLQRLCLWEDAQSILEEMKFHRLRYNHVDIPLSTLANKNLTVLHVEENIPFTEIVAHKHLEKLYLNDLGLSEIPETIGSFKTLKELYLWGNNLSALPSSIAHLTNLEVINISKNNITEIPQILLNLPNLHTICLRSVQNLAHIKDINPQAWERIQSGALQIIDASKKVTA